MNIQQKITLAVLQHAPVADLREILKAETHERLAYEHTISHANAMDMQGLMSCAQSLITRAGTDPLGFQTVKADLDDLLLTIGQLQTLARLLQS